VIEVDDDDNDSDDVDDDDDVVEVEKPVAEEESFDAELGMSHLLETTNVHILAHNRVTKTEMGQTYLCILLPRANYWI
jgi:hypothetical protein